MIICHSFVGKRYLGLPFITSKRREKCFIVFNISLLVGVMLTRLVIILTRNESHSVYKVMEMKLHWTVSCLSLLGFMGIVTILTLDMVANCHFTINALYLSYFSVRYWLHKIWLVWIINLTLAKSTKPFSMLLIP